VKLVSDGETLPFDVLLATPKSVSMFRIHGRVLGPKGLMPNEKRGTIVEDFATYGVRPEQKGIELKLDGDGKTRRGAILRVVVGKVLPHHSTFLIYSSNKTIMTLKQI
jgi:ribosomal protein L1